VSRTLRFALILTVVTIAVSAIALGRWQLRRLSARKASNTAMLAARTLPPLDLGGGDQVEGTVAGRRVTAKGVFDPAREILIRGRVQNQSPGLEVITPLVLGDSGRVIWIRRGFIRSPDAATPPEVIAAPDTGLVQVTGLAAEVPERSDSGKPLRRGTVTTWSRLDGAVMRSLAPRSLPFELLLAGDSTGPGRLEPVLPPALSDGPHLSYAIQWFGIALAAVLFGVIFLWRARPGSAQPPGAP
jgi:surfeit locus 1 family protein